MTVFRITDIDGMCRAMREDAFDNPVVGYPHESIGMDGYVTVPQIISQAMTLSSLDDDGSRFITDAGLEELERWVYGAITESSLARLAAWDLIDTVVDENGELSFVPKEVCDVDA